MEKISIKKLKSNPNNPRQIKDENFKKLVQSIKDFPEMMDIRPIVVNKQMIILGGNMRFRAAQEAGMKEVPCIIADITEDQEREFIIKDNVSGGEWDWDRLANEWDTDKLQEWGLDLPVDFGEALSAEEDDYTIPDEIETDIVLGDLFQIGEHRLLCGDSTDSDAVARLMDGVLVDMLITDPPYGVAYVGKTKDALQIQNDKMSADDTHLLWRDSLVTSLIFMKDGAIIYTTVPAGLLQVGFMQAMVETDTLHQCMVWNKGQMVLGHSDYHYQHEPILYGWKPGKHYFTSDRTKTTVFDYKKPMRNAEHPTMKPVELWSEMIGNSSRIGDLCYDSFLGSGTTMVAAHQLKRKCYGMELDPKYCQVIIDRMKKLDPSIEIKKL
jgi:DNA modification methylase